MNQDAKNTELLRRLSRGEYVVDAQAVAEAILRRRGGAPEAPPRQSEVLEASEDNRLAVCICES